MMTNSPTNNLITVSTPLGVTNSNPPKSRVKFIILISDYLFILGFLLFSFAILIAGRYPGNGLYEVSIYHAYPYIFWLLIILSLCVGYTKAFVDLLVLKERRRWIWGLILVLMTNGFLLSLPYFRDYFLNGLWDVPFHLSASLDISNNGLPNSEDFYPVLHILAIVFSKLSGFQLNEILNIFPVFFYFIGVCNSAVLAYAIDERTEVRGLIIILSSLLMYSFFQAMFYPTQVAVYFLPFFLGLLALTRYRKAQWKYSILLIMFLFFLPFLHPLGVITVLLAMIILFIVEWISPLNEIRFINAKLSRSFQLVITPILTLLVTWFTWFSTFRHFGMAMNKIIRALFYGISGFNSFESYSDAAQRASLDISTIVHLILYTYGTDLIIFAICMFSFLIMIWQIIFAKYRPSPMVYLFTIIFFFFFILGFFSLFFDLVAESPARYLNYALVVSPALISLILYDNIFQKINYGYLFIFFLICLLIITICISITGLYRIYYSSFTGEVNNHYSYSQYDGFKSFLKLESKGDGNIYSITGDHRNIFATMPLSETQLLLNNSIKWYIHISPTHFGYDNSSEFSEYYFDNPEYLYITANELNFYTNVWNLGGRVTPNDFKQLNDDSRWNKIYESGDFTLYNWRSDK